MTSFASHTLYSDPGRYAADLHALPAEPREAAACLRSLTLHYVASQNVPEHREQDRQARWIQDILDILKTRSSQSLNQERPPETRFVGCCRDDALLLTAVLREYGRPARIRVGWGPYLDPHFIHDHVVTEWHDGTRWIRGDPELPPEKFEFDTMDMPPGTFQTAGEAWLAFRAGTLDTNRYGVAPGLYGGPPMLRDYVVRELAALTGHELLLWDNWGLMNTSFEQMTERHLALLDEIAHALAIENPGEWQRLASHPDLRVPDEVMTFNFQDSFQPTDLRR